MTTDQAALAERRCESCDGLNIGCPDGCGRDPRTGELNGTRCQCAYCTTTTALKDRTHDD